jgi:hypothetical protein
LAENGVSTSVPYKGGLSGGGSFEVIAFDIFAIVGGSSINFFGLEDDVPVNLFYGPVTVTKVDEAAPASRANINIENAKARIAAMKASKASKVAGLQAKVRL